MQDKKKKIRRGGKTENVHLRVVQHPPARKHKPAGYASTLNQPEKLHWGGGGGGGAGVTRG